jgi:hypothetical protein
VVDRVDCVVVVVERVGVVVTVTVLVVEFELSPAMISTARPRPITSAIRIPTIRRVRLSTAAMLVEGAAENPESLVDLRVADHERRQEPECVGADRVGDQPLGQ